MYPYLQGTQSLTHLTMEQKDYLTMEQKDY